MQITSLHRYAVKGLSGDSIKSVALQQGDGTFEDDRRFALLYDDNGDRNNFDQNDPQWLHKDNFLCAFTAPELLATLRTEYKVEANDGRRVLTVWSRHGSNKQAPLLVADLACQAGRDETSKFFSDLSGKKVVCVCARSDVAKSSTGKDKHDGSSGRVKSQLSGKHTHQFGNTSSGVKNNNGDTRTIHIVNSNTVKQFSNAIQHDIEQEHKEGIDGHENEFESIRLNPTRFRPNVVVDGLEPWSEFDLIGKTIEVVSNQDNDAEGYGTKSTPLRFRITSRTVRCAGIGVDPLQPELGVIDVPKLLTKHFPQHGPYLGIYAVVDDCSCGSICVGETFRVLDK